MEQPLSEILRPSKISDFIGQAHLTKEGGIIYEIIKHNHPTSLIFWGPPGVGKTTLARIVASELKADFIELSAVMAGKQDVLRVIERARVNHNLGQSTILFIDEIHRFSKSQQDVFLPHVEAGLITLIGATTENPSFEIISPLLSRARVVCFNALNKAEIIEILLRARRFLKLTAKRLPRKAIEQLAELSGDDARVALSNLELCIATTKGGITIDSIIKITQHTITKTDKSGEGHYNLASAFIKSMRGSDVKATLYYLARMIKAGEDPKFIARRMIIFASEDIGLVGNGAMSLAVATFQAVERIGLPEAEYNLFHCALALAKSEKSRVVSDMMTNSKALVDKFPNSPIPLHMRNASTELMKDIGCQQGMKWEAGFKHPKGFLPTEIIDYLKSKN